MQQARLELGEEAMLLDARAASGEARHLGGHEVIFALPDQPQTAKREGGRVANGVSSGERSARNEDRAKADDDLLALRREIHQIREAVARTSSRTAPAGLESNPEISRFHSLMLASDTAPDVAEAVLGPCLRDRNVASKSPARSTEELIREQISKTLRARPEFDPSQGAGTGSQKLMIFVGPPGSGKTSALVKIAIQKGLASRKPLLILSVDNYRVSSAEQLRSFACILGVSFQHVETIRGVHSVLEEHRHKHWIFIDTPGCGPNETEVIQELSELTRLNAEIETHLVLSATMRSSDLKVAVRRFASFNPGKLLFTHLDETEQYGGLLSAATWTGKPVSFLSWGQRIPEDLEAATSDKLLDLVLPDPDLGRPRAAARSNQAGTAAAGYSG